MGTLDASLPESQKAFRTEQLANQWERHSPIPVQDREVPRVDETHNSGESATEKPRMPGYIAVSGVVTCIHMYVSTLTRTAHSPIHGCAFSYQEVFFIKMTCSVEVPCQLCPLEWQRKVPIGSSPTSEFLNKTPAINAPLKHQRNYQRDIFRDRYW